MIWITQVHNDGKFFAWMFRFLLFFLSKYVQGKTSFIVQSPNLWYSRVISDISPFSICGEIFHPIFEDKRYLGLTIVNIPFTITITIVKIVARSLPLNLLVWASL